MNWFLLLTPAQTTGILWEGLDVVAGRVLPEQEATFADADVARAAFGHPDPAAGTGRFVDFLLLPDDLPVLEVRDGELAPTRVPSGASYWRLEADGTRHLISHFDTPAFGWRNMRGDVWPASEVGLRARWNDLDVVAAFEHGTDPVVSPLGEGAEAGPDGDGTRLHLVDRSGAGGEPPEGFTWTKTGVSRRTVPVAECHLYERVSLVVHDGVPGRLLDVTDDVATVLLEAPAAGSRQLAPGWHQARLPVSDLVDVLTREVPRTV